MTSRELTIGEKITYEGLKEKDREYPDLKPLLASERYKTYCNRIHNNQCIWCNSNNIELIRNSVDPFIKFRCLSCKKKF